VTDQNSSVIKEAARLLGAKNAPAEFVREIVSAYNVLLAVVKPRSIYKSVSVAQTADGVLLDNALAITSRDLQKLFAHSRRAVLLAVTLGAEADALIRQKMAYDMPLATLLDACASAEVERVCDVLEQQIAARLGSCEFLTRRFSPGYGDVDIKYSSELVNALNTQKQIGLSVTSQAMLVPSKSVTALLGVSDKRENRFRLCEECAANGNCIYQKRNERCGATADA